MSAPVIAPHEQRRFLMVAFHPYGSDVCKLLGFPMPSLDVDEVERRAATAPWFDLMGEQASATYQHQITSDQVLGLAYLYEAAAASLISSQHPDYNRSLGQDLISFFIALISLGDTQ
jgi:hypothetical protein